jgi:NADH-ubiquinone oxidoreductase chain 4
MLLSSLLTIPVLGIFAISLLNEDNIGKSYAVYTKNIALGASLLNLIISFVVFIFFNFSSNNFQFVQEHYNIGFYDIYLGIDGLSIYFVLLTTIIMPIALVSN